jgi:hypothetical protein
MTLLDTHTVPSNIPKNPIASGSSNLSFGFCRYENRQGLEVNFVDLLERNSQVAIFESKSAKFDREITYFRVKKPKTQVLSKILPSPLKSRILTLNVVSSQSKTVIFFLYHTQN